MCALDNVIRLPEMKNAVIIVGEGLASRDNLVYEGLLLVHGDGGNGGEEPAIPQHSLVYVKSKQIKYI